jgi:hypothetical protein
MTATISYTTDPTKIEVRLSDAPVLYEFAGDVIADVNRAGNWINGLELLGSGLQFSLERAISSLARGSVDAPAKPQREPVVKYDEDANAGFLYLPYESSTKVEQEQRSNPLLLKASYAIEDDNATFGLAADKTLVFIRFAVPPKERLDTFLQLFHSQ